MASRDGANLGATRFDDLLQYPGGPAVDQAATATGADTIAKILFTSGSTGLPKGVVNTHGMLTANQQQLCQVWPFLFDQPLTLVDWLPWNHTFGSNHNFNMVLRHAGTLVIDGGRPLPAMVGETVRNLTEISPTIYFNVPAGYTVLLPFLERDEAFARSFFAKLRLIFYAGAALPQDLWDRLKPWPCVRPATASRCPPRGALPRPRRLPPPRISCSTARETSGCRCPACWR